MVSMNDSSHQQGIILHRLFIFILPLFFSSLFIGAGEKNAETINQNDELGVKTIEVLLQTHYLDGEISEETVLETIWSMEDFWTFYEDWQLVDQMEGSVIFKKELNDISPLLKMNGYFGLSEDGTLNIYFGNPDEDEVIHSFFQINTRKLKSHLHEELIKGIRISTKDHYLEVLKEYEEYAIREI